MHQGVWREWINILIMSKVPRSDYHDHDFQALTARTPLSLIRDFAPSRISKWYKKFLFINFESCASWLKISSILRGVWIGSNEMSPRTISWSLPQVVKHNTAFINGMVGSEIYAITNGRHNYHLARNTFYPQPYGIACPSGAPYTDVLNLMWVRKLEYVQQAVALLSYLK